MSERRVGQHVWWRMALISVLLGSCASGQGTPGAGEETARPVPRHVLTPLRVLTGARLAPATEPAGMPRPRAGPAPLTPFINPIAVAMWGNDLYIADAGAGRVFRFDVTLDIMTVVQPLAVPTATRLVVGADSSLYVLDPAGRRALKFARGGQLVAHYADERNLYRPITFVVDDVRGQVIFGDAFTPQLVAFHPLGRASEVVVLRGDERNRVMGITALALGRDSIHISDALCRCVAVVGRDGTVRATYGHHDLSQPGAIAIDRYQRVFVADGFDRSIKVFAAGRLVDHIPATALGVVEVTDISVSGARLMIADGPGARVVVMRIAPPREVE